MQQEQSKELMENILTEEELEKRGIEKVAEDEVFKHIYTSQASQMRYYVTNYGRIATQAAVNRRISFLSQSPQGRSEKRSIWPKDAAVS